MKKSQRGAPLPRAGESDNASVASSNSSGSGYRTRNKVKAEKENKIQIPSKDSSSHDTHSEKTPVDISSSTVQVSVRVRPLVHAEQEREESVAWLWGDHKTISQDPQFIPKRAAYNKDGECPSTAPAGYTFDHMYTPDHSNQHIYETNVHNIVRQTLDGYHGSVFTYGQTSSGKTYTMNGTLKQPGIIPQAIYDCFSSIDLFSDREFLFRVSYLEIYNETVNDLLNPDPKAQIKIQHDPKVGTKLTGVKEETVINPAQVMALLQGGEAYRHVSATDMNDKSSRAHTLFKLIVESSKKGTADRVRVSTLNLVDLAGSENAKMTNSKGERAREAKFINQSLLTLSTIIHKLSEESVKAGGGGGGRKRGVPIHLPYRDSKLTRILQTALSGNAYISIICTISPTVKCGEESHNTLKFASRAKKIKMKAEVNETVDDKTLLSQYRIEIDNLKAQLAQFQEMTALTAKNSNEGVVAQSTAAPETGRGSRRKMEDESESDEAAPSEQLILQMIGHMERLILKGDAAEKPSSQHHSPTKQSKIDRRRSDASTMSTHSHQRKGAIVAPSSESKSQKSLENKEKNLPVTEEKTEGNDDNDDETITEPNFKEMVEVQIENPFKDIIEDNNNPEGNMADDEVQIDENDDFFAELSRLSICGSPSRSRTTSNENQPAGNATAAERPSRQPFVINPRRVTLSHPNESGMRRMNKSADSEEESSLAGATHLRSSSQDKESSVDDLLAGHVKEDPVLYGVSQMLSILKQHVTKPKVKLPPPPPQPDQSKESTVTTTTSVEVAATVESEQNQQENDTIAALQEEVTRLQANVDKKDSMLTMLTDGLKEVEVNQATLLAHNEELGEILSDTRRDRDENMQAYNEVEDENKLIRAEMLRLQGCLEAREKQLFEITGKSQEEEQF